MNDGVLHAIGCNCPGCLDKWCKIEGDIGNTIQPQTCLWVRAIDGYETYAIDQNTVGVRPKWVKCSDRLPEDRVDVLVFNGDRCSVSAYLSEYFLNFGYHQWHHKVEDYNYSYVTHWMPQPKAPNE